MSAAFSIERPASSALKLNNILQQEFWFGSPATRSTLEAERCRQQGRLTGAFYLSIRHGFNLRLAGYITARDPELTDHFWVNPLGMHFSCIKVSDFLLMNTCGETAIGNRLLNEVVFAIHTAIHEAHPHIVVVAHTHPTYGRAQSALGRPLDPPTQDACSLYKDHALLDDFTSMVVDPSEGERTAYALIKPDSGIHEDVILKDHGILTAGPTAETTTRRYVALNNAVHTQLLAEAASMPQPVDTATACHTRSQAGGQEGALYAFESLYTGLVAAEPDVLDQAVA